MDRQNDWHNLYIVATPLGNLNDVTLRALETLREVNYIFCEDTRVSSNLLNHFSIKSKLISYHQHSSQNKISELIKILRNSDAALITDAGTPGISDPGNKLIDEVLSISGGDCKIIPIPGPAAVTAALSISGLPTDKFLFLGFLPHKKGRETILKQINNTEITTVFYESTHRILKTLEQLSVILDQKRKIVVCRELTKKFESIYRGNILQVLNQLKDGIVKGEFVVMVSGLK
ncbi:MAG: 16S rRNA (cytidine(1402)-2'-O)-methyltransferase [Candidatus Buchananbacteria bacterium]